MSISREAQINSAADAACFSQRVEDNAFHLDSKNGSLLFHLCVYSCPFMIVSRSPGGSTSPKAMAIGREAQINSAADAACFSQRVEDNAFHLDSRNGSLVFHLRVYSCPFVVVSRKAAPTSLRTRLRRVESRRTPTPKAFARPRFAQNPRDPCHPYCYRRKSSCFAKIFQQTNDPLNTPNDAKHSECRACVPLAAGIPAQARGSRYIISLWRSLAYLADNLRLRRSRTGPPWLCCSF